MTMHTRYLYYHVYLLDRSLGPHLTHTLRKMTNLVKRDLFGGAIKADLPGRFIDASYVIDRQSKLGAVPTNLDPA